MLSQFPIIKSDYLALKFKLMLAYLKIDVISILDTLSIILA